MPIGGWLMGKTFQKGIRRNSKGQMRPSSHLVFVVDGERGAQAKPARVDGIRCPFLALFSRVSPIRNANTRWSSTDSIVLLPTDSTVSHQRITSQAMFSLSSMQIHSRKSALQRSASGSRF